MTKTYAFDGGQQDKYRLSKDLNQNSIFSTTSHPIPTYPLHSFLKQMRHDWKGILTSGLLVVVPISQDTYSRIARCRLLSLTCFVYDIVVLAQALRYHNHGSASYCTNIAARHAQSHFWEYRLEAVAS